MDFGSVVADAVSGIQQELEKQALALQAAAAQRESEVSLAMSEVQEEKQQLAGRRLTHEQEFAGRRAEMECQYQQKAFALEEEKRLFEEEKARMSSNAAYGDVIPLNLGGEVMVDMTRGTLIQFEGSLLASMFSGRWDTNLGRDMNGRVLLDFKPALIRPLLDYLHAKRIETPEHPVPLPDVPPPLQEDFFRMIQHFGLEDHVLQRHIAWHWEDTDKEKEISTTLCVDKLEIIFGHWGAPVFGSKSFSSGIHSWAVQVTTSSGDNDLMCASGIGTTRTPGSGCQPYDRAVFYQPDVDGGGQSRVLPL